VEERMEEAAEEVAPEPVQDDVVVPEGLDDPDEDALPSDDLEETLRRGGNPWGPR
jgi:hypothetical protein